MVCVCLCVVKMHPPGIPQVNVTTNDTWISWSPGSPRSRFITSFQFNIQIKQGNQTWEVSATYTHMHGGPQKHIKKVTSKVSAWKSLLSFSK